MLGENEVARESEIGARARSDAVYGADYRERKRAKTANQRRVIFFDGGAEIDRRAVWSDGGIGQILSGTKAAARAGEQQHAYPVCRVAHA